MTHDEAVQSALRTATKVGGRLFRREVGLFWDKRGDAHSIGVKGEADLQGILPPGGWGFAVEIKTGKAKPSDKQKAWGRMWVKMGGLYVLARYSASSDGDAMIMVAVDDYRRTRKNGGDHG